MCAMGVMIHCLWLGVEQPAAEGALLSIAFPANGSIVDWDAEHKATYVIVTNLLL